MRWIRAITAVAFVAVAFPGCLSERKVAVEGRFEYSLEIPAGFVSDRRNQTLLGASTLPDATAFLNANLRLTRDIPVKYMLCDRANAFWNPATQTIEICHQLGSFLLPKIEAILKVSIEGEEPSQEAFDADVVGLTLNAVRFVFFHEVGHALIHLYDLPVTGREEDVADQFATWMMLRDKGPIRAHLTYDLNAGQGMALSGAVGFVAFARANTLSSTNRIDWAQSHSFDLQRAYNIVCWVYGSDPARLVWLTPSPTKAERLHVPPEREPWCKYEHDRINYAFTTLLRDRLR